MEDAQEALGTGPHDDALVTLCFIMVWYQELLRFAPTLLMLGSLIYFGRRMQSGLGIVGPGGKGGHGIFNIGKANVTKLDKIQRKRYYLRM